MSIMCVSKKRDVVKKLLFVIFAGFIGLFAQFAHADEYKCGRGYYLASDGKTCVRCVNGTYSTYCPGDDTQHPCPSVPNDEYKQYFYSYARWASDNLNSSVGHCRAFYLNMPIGHGLLGAACFYNATYGDYYHSSCQVENQGQTKCDAGYYTWRGSANYQIGNFATTINAEHCASVGYGYYSPANNTARTKCPVGTYTTSNTSGSSSACLSCTNPPQHATYSATNTTDGTSNCPWTCDEGHVQSESNKCSPAADARAITTVGFVNEQMAPLQDNFVGQSGTKAVTFGTESGQNIPRTVTDSMGNSTSDNSLPTAGAAKTALDAKQDTIPANDSNSVLTYTGVAGNIGSKGVYQDSGTYAEQMDDLVTAETFNSALANGLNNEFICAEYDPAEPDKCWLWEIRALNPNAKTNYFIMDRIPEWSPITRNADGSITITGYAVNTTKKLSELAPGLEVGKRYKYSITTTSSNRQMLLYKKEDDLIFWYNGTVKTITADMLNRKVYFYTSQTGTSDTISSIRIEEADDDTTILPTGYTQLEYIQSSSTQYIDTGITQSTRAVIDMQAPHISTEMVAFMYAPINASSWENGFGVYRDQITGPTVFDSAIRRTYDITYDNTSLTMSADGINRTTSSYHFPNNSQIALFGTTSAVRRITGKLYLAKIYNGDTLVAHFIPARRNSDNALGLYDIVRDTFLTNAGTGTFTAGPEQANNIYMPQNQ